MDESSKPGPESLEDVSAAHANGRPLAAPTGDPAIDRKRAADRARYAARRGRPPSNPAPIMAESVRFTAESCRPLVNLPFAIAAAKTKSDAWDLEESEEQVLSAPLASSLNDWFPNADAKWASLTAFLLAFISISGRKYAVWKEEVRSREPAKPAN